MRWMKALAALVALVALTIGPPTLLTVFIGNPVPADFALGAPLSDESLIGLLSIVVWVLWAQTMWCVVAEIVAALRSTGLARTPGTFAVQQALIRSLISAVVVATVTLPLAAGASESFVERRDGPSRDSAQLLDDRPHEPEASASSVSEKSPGVIDRSEGATISVEVQRGDSLWSIAEAHLGDGNRWSDIAALNSGRSMGGGMFFRTSDPIQPGWSLLVPAAQSPAAAALHEHIVRPGESLSQIAFENLGDGARWPELFEQSKALDQDIPISDPDLIYPGQRIVLDGDSAASPEVESVNKAPDAVEEYQSPRSIDKEVAPGPLESTQSPASAIDESSTVSPAELEDQTIPSWVMPGLLGAGTLLAGSLLVSLRRRRAVQHRMRRPGRAISVGGPDVVAAEKSVSVVGADSADLVERLDAVLKRLAATLTQAHQELPDLAAVELTPTAIALHLRMAMSAPSLWTPSDDGCVWVVDRSVVLDHGDDDLPDSPAPWPLLVTVGHDDHGHVWLLNIEDQDMVISGDAVAVDDLSRYVAAEIACNPWSKDTALDLFGVAREIVPMGPDRVHFHQVPSPATDDAVADAVRNIHRLSGGVVGSATARARQDDPDLWPSRVLIVGRNQQPQAFGQIRGLIHDHVGHTATAVIGVGADATSALAVHVDERRRLRIPSVNLDLLAVGLTSDEASGCASLLAQADALPDAPVPNIEGPEAWQGLATETGSLRREYTAPRSASTIELSSSLLASDDDTYTGVAATTVDDLAALAPRVLESVRKGVAEADPELDADLADWFSDDCVRPRLTLLGPVHARTKGKALDRRRAFYTELYAYLATRPYGATTDEVAAAFDLTPARVRVDINRLRDWLGSDPLTGAKYLPDAREAPSARHRGIGVYEVVDGLVDVDLFRRLRVRAESRGPEGITDLRMALRLVSGRPFQKLRPGGWGWLFEADRLDLHMTCAVVDVAHIVTTSALAEENLDVAYRAASLALSAAPDEEIPRLDLAAVLKAQGHESESDQLLREEICNRVDETGLAADLPIRSEAIIREHGWLNRSAM